MATETIDQELAKPVSQTAEISPSNSGCGVWPDGIAPDIDQIEIRIKNRQANN